MVRVCFVCLGNICRSPTAEGIFRHLVRQEGLEAAFTIESAGTGDWHVGEAPDRRARETAKRRGFALEGTARAFGRKDFARFDYVVAMDVSNRRNLLRIAPDDDARQKIHLLRSFDPESAADAEVPDPYYGGGDGFEQVFDICEAACRGFLSHLREAGELS